MGAQPVLSSSPTRGIEVERQSLCDPAGTPYLFSHSEQSTTVFVPLSNTASVCAYV